MADRFYTFMVIPERSSAVKKWIVPVKSLKIGLGIAVSLVVVFLMTSMMTLRFLSKDGEFKQTVLRNHYLEGQLELLKSKVATSDATMVRIQNFEQKLRTLAKLDQQQVSGAGFGPITGEEERIFKGEVEGNEIAGDEGRENLTDVDLKARSMELTIDQVANRALLQEQSLAELYELLKDQESLLSSTPSVWPTKGWITSQFGYRISPFTGLRQLHDGLDIAAQVGTKIFAPADGVVTNTSIEDGYGKVVAINHGYGVVTRFGHNAEIVVKLGQRVRRGDPIALVGSTGRATGPHLHYEVRVNGIPVNPFRYILN